MSTFLCFRELVPFGVLPGTADLTIVARYDGVHPVRKGDAEYARRMWALAQVVGVPPATMLVVGDGRGDIRFCQHLRAVAESSHSRVEVKGVFLAHQETEEFFTPGPGMHLFETWSEVCGFVRGVSVLAPVTTFCDVDRTLFLPRLVMDGEYQRLRRQTMSTFIEGFLKLPLSDVSNMVQSAIEAASARFFPYLNAGDRMAFRNEECCGLGALLLASGILPSSQLGDGTSDFRTVLLDAQAKASRGGWFVEQHGQSVQADAIWNQKTLLDEIARALQLLDSGAPVLVPRFRAVEAETLSSNPQVEADVNWNEQLFSALEQLPGSLFCLSDRPGISMGFRYTPDQLAYCEGRLGLSLLQRLVRNQEL